MDNKALCYNHSFYCGIAERANVMFCEWILIHYRVNNIIISNDLERTFVIRHKNLKENIHMGMLQFPVIFVISLRQYCESKRLARVKKYKFSLTGCDLALTNNRNQDFKIMEGEVWNILPTRMFKEN